MTKTHELNLLHTFFEEVLCGVKTFEIRENDRGFQKGDQLILRQQIPGQTSRRRIRCTVAYVLSGWGLKNGYVALSLQDVEEIAP